MTDDSRFDNCSEQGALRLAERITNYWHARGYQGIIAKPTNVRITHPAYNGSNVWAVISNIGPRGYPPLHLY